MSDNDEEEAVEEGSEEESVEAAEEEEEKAEKVEEEETETETEAEEGEEEKQDVVEEGDYVRLAYTATTTDEDGEEILVDTTSEDRAAGEGVDTEEQEFGPRVIAVGEGHLFEDVEEAVVGKVAGEEGEVTVPAEDAFGEHDPDDVETVSANKIDEDDRYPGARVNIDGRQGHIETIIGGRARIDFNHPLAGDDVTYEFEVIDIVDDEEEQIVATIDTYIGTEVEVEIDTVTETETRMEEVETDEDEDDDEPPELEEVEEEVEKRVLYIEATPEMSMNQQWLFSKQQVVDELMHDFDFDRVVVRETFDHGDMHGGMGGMGGMMPGMGGAGTGADLEDIEDMDEEEMEELAEEIEGVEIEE